MKKRRCLMLTDSAWDALGALASLYKQSRSVCAEQVIIQKLSEIEVIDG